MKYRGLDANGDMLFGQSSYNFLTDINAVAQAIQTNLLFLYEEWWEDQDAGTPLFQSMLGQRMTDAGKQSVDMLIKERILSTVGTISLSSYTSAFDLYKNTFTITISIETVYGTLTNQTFELGV
jgi:hypothetical protein